MNKLHNTVMYKDLFEYTPFNDIEIKDKEFILDFMLNNDDSFYRTNLIGHITSTAWILNKEHNKVLMVYHNIYKTWSLTGGHNDGNINSLEVALKEAKEETGIKNIKPLSDKIYSIEVIAVSGHYKNNKYVNSHLHLNFTYLFEADESDKLYIKEDENKDVKWMDINDVISSSNETWFKENVYPKLILKMKAFGL